MNASRRLLLDIPLWKEALQNSFPVLLGYTAIGLAFGLLLSGAGYPWWLALAMCVIMYAGAGQYIAVGLFAAGTTLWEAVLVQLVVNARHIAYGLSMMNRFKNAGPVRWYLIFGLTDETFALLSSLPSEESLSKERKGKGEVAGIRSDPLAPAPQSGFSAPPSAGAPPPPFSSSPSPRLMFLITLLNHGYWVLGGVIGAVAGTLIPFDTDGISFALTALFIVLMIEQMYRVRRPQIFIVSAAAAVVCTLFLPLRISLLAAIALALAFSSFLPQKTPS